MSWKYYVYELIDPRDDSVFYVGKGTGKRIHAHERQAADGVSSKKCNKIREIQAAGLAVTKRQVACFADEKSAYEFESKRILEIGRERLTNITLRGGPPISQNAFLSDYWMKSLAMGFKYLVGYRIDYTNRPFAAALSRAFMRRFPQLVEKTVLEIGEDAMIAGVRKFGVDLQWRPA